MTTPTRPLAEVTEEAIGILYRELGVVDTVRFLRQFATDLGDYTEERQALDAGESVADILRAIQLGRAETRKPGK
jgi:hypothetical protein